MPDWNVTVSGPTGLRISRSFLVDTGASKSLLPIAEARALRLPLLRWATVATANGPPVKTPVVKAKISVEGCGYFDAEFYAITGQIYAVGLPIIRQCGLSIPARGA